MTAALKVRPSGPRADGRAMAMVVVMSTAGGSPPSWADRREAKRRAQRQQLWSDFRTDVGQQWREERMLAKARTADHDAAVASGEIDRWTGMSSHVHFLITVLTAGAWAPIWIYVEIRNHRRWRRTSVGRNDRARREVLRTDRRDRQRQAARARARQNWSELAFWRR